MTASAKSKPVRYARFRAGRKVSYGVVEGNKVRVLAGDLFGKWTKTDTTHALKDVTLLVPCRPTKVLALAGSYKSHLPGESIPDKFKIPQVFYKPPSCLIAAGAEIVIPPGTASVHYEAEMVVVIGKRASNVQPEDVAGHILGVTCGNDVSARDWQKDDVQWWRAKGSDTFGPVGPYIVADVDYDNLRLRLRLNGEVKQDECTANLIHGVAGIISFISRHVTLEPGDLIFTGTTGKTSEIRPGDVVEVDIEGVGVLRNPVRAAEG
jgi:2-keto-4-pentenoate hydratase/2-oxohepta-3-ene-1,7-dioic acid hydratase in catechol pathway